MSLETGTTAAFAPARALYQSAGFVPCGAFAGYQPSQDNLFMTLELDVAQTAGLAAAVLHLAYLPDRFTYAASPGIAMPREHVISGDPIESCQ